MDVARVFPEVSVAFHISGEPLLHPKVILFVKAVRAAGLKSRLVTNATLLSEHNSVELIKAGLDQISFSFEGYSKEIYEAVRTGASYERTLAGIEAFIFANNQAGHPVRTELVYVDLPEVKEWSSLFLLQCVIR